MKLDDFLDLVHSRRSIRILKPDPIPDEIVEKILEAGRWAMSGGNAQPWEFIVIKDKKVIHKLADLYINTCRKTGVELEGHLKDEFWQPATLVREGPPGWRNAPVVIAVVGDQRATQASTIMAYLFGGQDVLKMALATCGQIMHLAAAAAGLGSQWQSIAHVHEEQFKALLGIPDYFRFRYIIPLGYPAYQPGPAYRRELSEIIHHDRFDMTKFRTNEDVAAWITALRKKMRARYPKMGEKEGK